MARVDAVLDVRAKACAELSARNAEDGAYSE